jgi:hypothetical protein
MTFKEFLIHYNIPYEYLDDNTLYVKDEDLVKYDKELKEKFPRFEYTWEFHRHHNPPNNSTSENRD